jgi:uncharacterized protein YjbJ (UPF0337 family)
MISILSGWGALTCLYPLDGGPITASIDIPAVRRASLGVVTEREDHPATWENVVVGKAKQAIGHVIGDEELEEAGEEQEDIAHEVHDEAEADRSDEARP